MLLTAWSPQLSLMLTLQTSPDGNVTVSSLWITAREDDDGDVITCKAELPHLPLSTVENSWNLQVNCK